MKNTINLIIIILFLSALALPNIIMLFDKKIANTNLDISIQQPLISIGKLKNFYLDNYGTKATLVKEYINFKSKFSKENPIPNRVIKGKNGWLYLGNYYNNVFNNSFGNNTFSDKQFNAIKNNLINCNNYLKAKNIKFYTVIAPDKNKIYQEFLPFQLKQNLNNVELLNQVLPEDLKVIDLEKTLLYNKKNQQLYLKTDTHWNHYGAFHGFKKILKHIDKDNNLKMVKLSDFNTFTENNFQGDLTRMIQSTITETNIKLKAKPYFETEVINYNSYYQHYRNINGKGKIMIYRDSFSNALIPFLNATFKEVILIKKHNLDKALIKSFNPDIVLFEIIERNLSFFEKIKTP